ncbi:sensor histidine kinase [Cellulomonas uda]|uniref:sensor histidine kinase n=1 Tax=Cellulomonas uda TaxID=1714 RepID=UPI001144977F|nr:ATP-binding protein [Cellulomonas uda]NII67875.1 signal transduction histidine kinase [Cellulomonas uda]
MSTPPGVDRRRRGSGFLRFVSRYTGPEAGVVERQLPFVLAFSVGMVVLAVVDVVVDPTLVLASAIVTVAVLVLAVTLPWRRWPAWAADVLPVASLGAVSLLRAGTGGPSSVLAALLFIPVLTLASQRGRRGVTLATVCVVLVVFTPAVIDPSTFTSLTVARAVVVALVAFVLALVSHETTERLRVRNAALDRLRVDQDELLDLVRTDAEVIARVAAARESALEQMVAVIDSATEQAIIATDADGVIQVFNAGAERLLGHAQGSVVGRLRLTALHDPDELRERYRSATGHDVRGEGEQADRRLLDVVVSPARGDGSNVRDWTWVRRDGERRTVRLAVTRRVEGDGASSGLVVVATDVTAEREAAAFKDQFVSLVSHELRTPLTAVLGYLELLQDGPDPLSDEQREYVTIIERNARRQLRLVSDLLLTAQVDAGTFQVSPTRIDLADVVRSSVASAAYAAQNAGVTLTQDVAPTPVVADATRLAQVVDNLLTNAIKFTRPGGTVVVSVAPGPPDESGRTGAVLEVSDSGVGIAPDEIARLTQRFFRAASAQRGAVPGVGLGLSIAKAVVDAHGGTLDVASTLGEGTTMTVRLPAQPEDPRG